MTITTNSPSALKNNLLYGCLQAFYYVSIGSYFAYLILFLKKYGYSDVQISLIMTMMAFITMAVPPLGGYITDFLLSSKKMVAGSLFLSVPAGFLLKFFARSLPLTVAAVFLISVLVKGIGTILDSWGMKLQQQGVALNYGVSRGIASACYAAAMVVLGRLYDDFGLELMFYVYAVLAALAGAAALFLQDVPASPIKKEKHSEDSVLQIAKSLTKNPHYILLIITMVLHGISLAATNTLQPLYLTQLGGASADLGLLLFVSAMSEVPMMCSIGTLSKKFNPRALVLAGTIGGVARLYAISLAAGIPALIGVQVIQSLSYGLYYTAALVYTCAITNPRITATAVAVGSAVGYGFSGIIGNALCSVLLEWIPMPRLFAVFALINVGAVLVFLLEFLPNRFRFKRRNA